MGPNIILDTLLDTFLKTHDYTLFLPILKEVCGDLAEDVQLEDLRTYRERRLTKANTSTYPSDHPE